MEVAVKINTDTPTGKRLVNDLKRYHKEVTFENPAKTGNIPEGYVSLDEAFDRVTQHVKSLYE